MPLVDTIRPPKGCLWLSVLGHWCPTTCADVLQEVKLSLSGRGRGKTYERMAHERTWTRLPSSLFQRVGLKLATKGSPCFCYVPSGISGFPENIFHLLMQGEQKQEGEENTQKRSLIKPRKFGKFALILKGSIREGPESELRGSCKTALGFSKVIYVWLVISKNMSPE